MQSGFCHGWLEGELEDLHVGSRVTRVAPSTFGPFISDALRSGSPEPLPSQEGSDSQTRQSHD